MPTLKPITELQPGDVVIYAGQPHQVVAHPQQSKYFSFYIYLTLLNLETREHLEDAFLSSSRLRTFDNQAISK